jgi:hypothetical protein
VRGVTACDKLGTRSEVGAHIHGQTRMATRLSDGGQ